MKLSKKTTDILTGLSMAQVREVRDAAAKLLETMADLRKRAALESRLLPVTPAGIRGATPAAQARFRGGFFQERFSTGRYSPRLYAKSARGVLYALEPYAGAQWTRV